MNIFNKKSHNVDLYNIILSLSRNIFFYKINKLPDTFETRIYLMFFHFSILLIIFKKKGEKFDQNHYDKFFNKIEYNLRELGFGDVSVNSKMKDFNKILYDILLKIELKNSDTFEAFKLNYNLVIKYFSTLDNKEKTNYDQFEAYFIKFYNFCFDQSCKNMLKELNKFKQ